MPIDQLLQHHERQVLQEVRTKATSTRSKFAKELALMKTAAKDKASRVASMAANK